MIEVKRIEPENIQSLSQGLNTLIESFSLNHLTKLVKDDRSYFLVAILDKQPVGYILVYKFPALNSNKTLAYLYDIEVLESHRRNGIGRKLIEDILVVLKNAEVEELWLGTATDNLAGQALFKSTGAEKSNEIFHDYTYTL